MAPLHEKAPVGSQTVAAPRHSLWRRELALARAVTSAASNSRKFRSLRVSAILLSFSALGSVLLVTHLGAGDISGIIALRIVAYAAWLYGLLGVWALLSAESLSFQAKSFVEQRGLTCTPWRHFSLGVAWHLFIGMCVAGLPGVIAALLLSPDWSTLHQRASLLAATIMYLASLGLVLGILSSFCVRFTPRTPRLILSLLVFSPFAWSFIEDGFPSIPGAYVWGLTQMLHWSGMA